MKYPVWIDCDPGLDDFLAITGAINSPELEIAGFSSVSGNVNAEMTTRNLGDILSFYGCSIPFAQGALKPLKREFVDASYMHGKSGLGSLVLPDAGGKPVPEGAPRAIYDCAKKMNGELILITIGPLTNIAHLLLEYPDAASRIKRIVMMGGGCGKGNITSHAEFNIYADPESAGIVFQSGIPITMVGLNATEEAFLTEDEIEQHFNGGNERRKAIYTALINLCRANEKFTGKPRACIHDLLTVFAVFNESLLDLKPGLVEVETTDKEKYGMTKCDFPQQDKSANTRIALHCSRDDFLREALKRLY